MKSLIAVLAIGVVISLGFAACDSGGVMNEDAATELTAPGGSPREVKVPVCHVGNELPEYDATCTEGCGDAGKIDLIKVPFSVAEKHLANPDHSYGGVSDYYPGDVGASGEGDEDTDGDGIAEGCGISLVVMTWNVYFGGDIGPVLQSGSVEELLANTSTLWASVQQTDFTERAEKIAKEIAVRKPDIVGLQEAALWRTQTPGDFFSGVFTPNAETVAYDFVEILLDALEQQGMLYEVLKIVEGSDSEAPNYFSDVRLTDRDVILARADHTPQSLKFSNAQGGNFDARLTVELLVIELEGLNNWASVDVEAPDGTNLRFVTTHLSAFAEELRIAQAGELLSGPLDTPMPVILVGDMNSNATTAEPAYVRLITEGTMTDSWVGAGVGDGFTAYQDKDLLNPQSALYKRIDMVLYSDGFRALHADLAGDKVEDKTASGLWPSDHAGVSVRLLFTDKPGM